MTRLKLSKLDGAIVSSDFDRRLMMLESKKLLQHEKTTINIGNNQLHFVAMVDLKSKEMILKMIQDERYSSVRAAVLPFVAGSGEATLICSSPHHATIGEERAATVIVTTAKNLKWPHEAGPLYGDYGSSTDGQRFNLFKKILTEQVKFGNIIDRDAAVASWYHNNAYTTKANRIHLLFSVVLQRKDEHYVSAVNAAANKFANAVEPYYEGRPSMQLKLRCMACAACNVRLRDHQDAGESGTVPTVICGSCGKFFSITCIGMSPNDTVIFLMGGAVYKCDTCKKQ